MTENNTYKCHFNAFEQNIKFAARILHYYLHMGSLAQLDTAEYKALNYNARFWNDFNFIALQTTIIFLGKIFDKDTRTHNIRALLKSLSLNLKYFSKNSLRQRKINLGSTDGIDEYISNAHELDQSDIHDIHAEVDKAVMLWQKIQPLRHQVYAHNQMLSNEAKDALFKQVTYDDLEYLVQILLNVCFALEQAELNGRKPDFSDDHSGPINVADGQIIKLMKVLVNGMSK